MEKDVKNKYIIVANGKLVDPYGLEVILENQIVRQIKSKENQSHPLYGRSYDDSYSDSHCFFTNSISDAHTESKLKSAFDYAKRCTKIHKDLKFEVYEMSIEYSARPYSKDEDPEEDSCIF